MISPHSHRPRIRLLGGLSCRPAAMEAGGVRGSTRQEFEGAGLSGTQLPVSCIPRVLAGRCG